MRSDWKFWCVVAKFEVGIEKNKLGRRRNIVEKSQKSVEKIQHDRHLVVTHVFYILSDVAVRP